MAVFMERPPPFRSIPQAPIANTDSSRLLILSAKAQQNTGREEGLSAKLEEERVVLLGGGVKIMVSQGRNDVVGGSGSGGKVQSDDVFVEIPETAHLISQG
ncbi:hypothetical protein OROMI_014928 [Orobanche minor]